MFDYKNCSEDNQLKYDNMRRNQECKLKFKI